MWRTKFSAGVEAGISRGIGKGGSATVVEGEKIDLFPLGLSLSLSLTAFLKSDPAEFTKCLKRLYDVKQHIKRINNKRIVLNFVAMLLLLFSQFPHHFIASVRPTLRQRPTPNTCERLSSRQKNNFGRIRCYSSCYSIAAAVKTESRWNLVFPGGEEISGGLV
jgi:hypothetical protein